MSTPQGLSVGRNDPRASDGWCGDHIGSKDGCGPQDGCSSVNVIPQLKHHLNVYVSTDPDAPVSVGEKGGPLLVKSLNKAWTPRGPE